MAQFKFEFVFFNNISAHLNDSLHKFKIKVFYSRLTVNNPSRMVEFRRHWSGSVALQASRGGPHTGTGTSGAGAARLQFMFTWPMECLYIMCLMAACLSNFEGNFCFKTFTVCYRDDLTTWRWHFHLRLDDLMIIFSLDHYAGYNCLHFAGQISWHPPGKI
jgi:hypothetical protein